MRWPVFLVHMRANQRLNQSGGQAVGRQVGGQQAGGWEAGGQRAAERPGCRAAGWAAGRGGRVVSKDGQVAGRVARWFGERPGSISLYVCVCVCVGLGPLNPSHLNS